jgi:hypothetical protein
MKKNFQVFRDGTRPKGVENHQTWGASDQDVNRTAGKVGKSDSPDHPFQKGAMKRAFSKDFGISRGRS